MGHCENVMFNDFNKRNPRATELRVVRTRRAGSFTTTTKRGIRLVVSPTLTRMVGGSGTATTTSTTTRKTAKAAATTTTRTTMVKNTSTRTSMATGSQIRRSSPRVKRPSAEQNDSQVSEPEGKRASKKKRTMTTKAGAMLAAVAVSAAANLPPSQTLSHSPHFASSRGRTHSSSSLPSSALSQFRAKATTTTTTMKAEESNEAPGSSPRSSSSPSSSSSSPPPQKKDAPRTESFGALWAGNYEKLNDPSVKVHTLLLGTHPSIASLGKQQYYAHPLK